MRLIVTWRRIASWVLLAALATVVAGLLRWVVDDWQDKGWILVVGFIGWGFFFDCVGRPLLAWGRVGIEQPTP